VTESLPPGDELARIAEEASASARAAGVDPRELAAALFAAPAAAVAEPGAATTPTADRGRGSHPFAAEARKRAALRAEIAGFERELAALELPAATAEEPKPGRGGERPAPQLLTAADLERVRDELAERLQSLRADRTVVRQERKRVRTEDDDEPRRHNAIGTDAPQIVSGAGGFSFRWRG
jgi:hypothetical protein